MNNGPNINISNNPNTVSGGDMGVVIDGGTSGILMQHGNITTSDKITAGQVTGTTVRSTVNGATIQMAIDPFGNAGISTFSSGGVTPETLYITCDGSPTPGVVLDTHGNAFIGYQGIVATDAVNGFAYIPKCDGTPTGLPADLGHGMLPMVIDYTNSKMYFHNGTVWVALN